MVLGACTEFFFFTKTASYFSQFFSILLMVIYDHLLPKNFRTAACILFKNTIEFVSDVTIMAFYEYGGGAEADVSLFQCKCELKINCKHYLQQ